MNRKRPYDGQPHTDYGERGKTIVEGLTMRDICDCYVRGVILASGHVVPELYTEACKGEDANLCRNDLYGWDLTQTDPCAIQQNMMCEVEKMMGIFPNLTSTKDQQLSDLRKQVEVLREALNRLLGEMEEFHQGNGDTEIRPETYLKAREALQQTEPEGE